MSGRRAALGPHFDYSHRFLLLEAQIISKMALLFGTTWVVNSIVIAALLSLIVGANFLVHLKPHFAVSIAYGGIFLSLLASYSIPLQRFFFTSLLVKIVAVTVVLCLPVFFAGTSLSAVLRRRASVERR